MLFVMITMFMVTSYASGVGQERALNGMNRIHDTWMELERIETDVVKQVENGKFIANMIVWYVNPAVQLSLAEGFAEDVAQTEEYLAEMRAICESLTEEDLAGTSKTELLAALDTYIEALNAAEEALNNLMYTTSENYIVATKNMVR